MVSGICTYGFLVLTARLLGVEDYASFAVAWSLALVIGAGIYVPIEQETSRVVARSAALGHPTAPAVRRMALSCAVLTALTALVVVAAAPLLLPLLDDDVPLLLALVATAPAMAVPFLLRGVLAGRHRFGGYAAVVVVEAVLRLGGVLLVAAVGVRTAAACVAVVAASAALSALPGLMRRSSDSGGAHGRGEAVPGGESTGNGRAVAALVAAALAGQVLLNAGPVLVAVLAEPEERTAASRLLAGLLLARVPLFLFTAVQAAVVPRLTADVARHDLAGFRATVLRLVRLVGATTGVVAVGCLVAGEPLMGLLFGEAFGLPGGQLALLSLGVGCYLVAATAGAALLAVGSHARVARSWLLGLMVLAAVTALVPDLLLRIELGFVVGCAAAAVFLLVDLRAWARRARA